MVPCKCGSYDMCLIFVDNKFRVECRQPGCSGGRGCNLLYSAQDAWAAWEELMGEEKPETRRPVGLCEIKSDVGIKKTCSPFAICNDGTSWIFEGKWNQLPSIPGTSADKENP